MIQTAKFKLKGMHCTSCAMNIDGELEDAPGITEANTSYAKGQVEVVFDSEKISEAGIIEIIKRIGYDAKAEG